MNIICVPVRRMKKGQKTCKTMAVTYDRNIDGDLPRMTIEKTEYVVEDIVAGSEFGVGRAFLLNKLDPENPECYSVFVSTNPDGIGDFCDCIGFGKGGYCKHCDVLRHLVTEGVIDDPLDGVWEDEPIDPDLFWDTYELPPVETRDYEFADATPFCE